MNAILYKCLPLDGGGSMGVTDELPALPFPSHRGRGSNIEIDIIVDKCHGREPVGLY